MSRKVEALIGYLKHSFGVQSKYHIHSPFVFDFYSKVLQNGQSYPQYRVINRLRRELETVSRFIKRKDLGVRVRDFPSDQRFVRVKDIAHRSSVSRKKGELLFRLTRYYKPSSIMELGTSLGISTIYMGLAAPESKILTIEGCIDSAKIAHENFEKSGLHNIQIITGNIDDKLSMAFDEMAVPDLIFIDGNQRKEPTLDYFEQILQHIHPGTVLIIDDIHCSGGMTEAWNTIRGHSRVKVSIDLYQMGIVFFKEELSKEDFILRY
jgi:predicted O-methyltransferase YrrM